MVDVVGGRGVGVGVGVLPPPPPQELIPNAKIATIAICHKCLRFFFSEKTSANTEANTMGSPLKGELCNLALVVVLTVTVKGAVGAAALIVTDVGLMEQVVPAGAPEHVSATVPLKGFAPVVAPS